MAEDVEADRSDLGMRVARLFREAGLVSAEDWEKKRSKGKKYKNLGEVLAQDAFSLGTFHDLFFKAELIPFKKTRSETASALNRELSHSVDTSTADLVDMLARHHPPTKHVVALLDKAGIATDGLRTGLKQAKKLKEKPYPWLIRHDLLTGETVRRFMESPKNPLHSACALAISLTILAHNDLVDERKVVELLGAITPETLESDEAMDAVRASARAAVGLSASDLLDRLEAGLYLEEVDGAIVPDAGLMDLFPSGFIHKQTFVPTGQDETFFRLATDDPLDLPLAVWIRFLTGKWPRLSFAPSKDVQDLIHTYYTGEAPPETPAAAIKTDVAPAPAVETAPDRAPAKKPAPAERRGPEVPVDSLSAVQLVSSMLESAIDLGATDIHLEPRREGTVVRFRIDGALNKILNVPPNLTGAVASRIKVLANMDVTERRRPQDGHITLDMDERHFDFRIATLPTPYGEKIAIRILDSARVMTGLAEVGLAPRQLKQLQRLVRLPHGIVLVTGPTGSGKTSTLYAALQELNREDMHLITIEDPIEYQIAGINQVQVDPNTNLSFSEGLRAILRQDPNVIMVGEIRDPDTAKTAIRAALTGHLVFSTLHTNTALGAFNALANMGATPYLIGSAVVGVIAQRLVRKLCTKCRRPIADPAPLVAQLQAPPKADRVWYEPVGCADCLGSGYSGRIGIFEVLEMTETLRRAVIDDETPTRLGEIADAEGRVSMRETGLEKVETGVTSPAEIVSRVMLDS